ncbi:MAG: hypothetical protein SF162_11925 [bacterium]|nr:hypothetical protein [bacterium]
MADSIFDNRYRYDYIYPRGRSGETLRAVDLQEGERLVVIKRPAPQDAPPIRSGQEVSILNERKALQRLASHPAITTYLGGGQFTVSGTQHQYIVMERAAGETVADLVLELDKHGDRLPELEMLVIVDLLLDLLNSAHSYDIVYNDVDAKHLFWDREGYRLKVIDWGNAVFLEGDEITPQGISRQTDIYQAAELMYTILTGGGRMEVPRDAGDGFKLNFGHDQERIHTRLQSIVSRAAHPNPRLRYRSVAELRKDLADYRAPLERERNALIGRVNERLRRDLSKSDLTGLARTLEPAILADPGYPPGRQTAAEIQHRLTDLDVGADLDAARIYMTNGNWTRAGGLLAELRPRARAMTANLIDLFIDWSGTLQTQRPPLPAAVGEAVAMLFDGQYAGAVNALVTRDLHQPNTRGLQYTLADQVAAHIPDILLLRPPLHRLSEALTRLTADGLIVSEPRVALVEIQNQLDALAEIIDANLIRLRDGYRLLVDELTALATLFESTMQQYGLSEERLPISALVRATNAAMALADNMHVIGKRAAAAPREALGALDACRVIDPTNPSWDVIGQLLASLYEVLGRFQTYIPSADGLDLENWFTAARRELIPYNERLFDEMLAGMVSGLEIGGRSWAGYAETVVQGNRIGAITALASASEAVGTVSPTLAGWFNQLRTVIGSASYIERHALYGALGRALADGWENFDRGRLVESERLGGTAYEAGRDDAERYAARRLRELAAIARDWLDRSGIVDARRTEAALTALELLYTADEIAMRDGFNAQMPSKDTFLKAMNKGLVDLYARRSTAAVRILFVNYGLLGALDAQEDRLDDAAFWRDAAIRVLGESSARHPLVRALEDFIQRRRDLLAAAELLNAVRNAQALTTLDQTRKALDDNAQAKLLTAAGYSLREVEAALRDWSDGEFRAAGIKLENALKAVDDVETAGSITLTAYRAYLMELVGKAAELHTNARRINQIIESRPETPPETLQAWHHEQVATTARLIGDAYAANLRQWRDSYEAFLSVYTDRTMRRSTKLTRFNDLFGAMFIDRHPAYPLYRFWFTLTEQSSEFPAPPTQDPVPRVTEEALTDVPPDPTLTRRARRDQEGSPAPRRNMPLVITALVAGIGLVGAGILLSTGALNGGAGEVTGTTPALAAEQTDPAAAFTDESGSTPTDLPFISEADPTPTEPTPNGLAIVNTLPPRPTDTITRTARPSATATRTPTITRTATMTFTSSATFTASTTPSATHTASPTPPPNGVQGRADLLTLLGSVESDPFWNAEQFSQQSEDGETFWRLGVGTLADGIITISPPAALLAARYGREPETRIVRAETTLSLVTYNPPLLIDDEVYFGVLLQAGDNPSNVAGVEFRVSESGALSLSQREQTNTTMLAQRAYALDTPIRVRLERNLNDETLTVFVENTPLGQPIPFVGAGEAVFPVLYVHAGGVIVDIAAWEITLL